MAEHSDGCTFDSNNEPQSNANLNINYRNEQNQSGLRNSGISIRQGNAPGKYMKINMGGMSNATGDSVF